MMFSIINALIKYVGTCVWLVFHFHGNLDAYYYGSVLMATPTEHIYFHHGV